MNKKLAAKIQKIVPKTESTASTFSNILTIHPENATAAKRKGTIYAVFDISSPIELEQPVITNLINDVLHDTYYQADTISPIQSLEKAIAAVKTNLSKLYKGNGKGPKINIAFNIVAGVLWGNVFYIVQHGKGDSYITREGNTKPISVVSEGNSSAASGVVKNEDVIVLATHTFAEAYLPKKLFEVSQEGFKNLPPTASCLMLKFSIETAFSEEERIDFNIPHKKRGRLQQIGKSIKKMFKRKTPTPTNSITTLKNPTPPIKRRHSLKAPKERKSIISKVAIPLVTLLLLISIGFSIKNRNTSTELIPTAKETDAPAKTTEGVKKTTGDPAKKVDETIETVPAQPLYDLKLVEETAAPTNIALVNNLLVVTDTESGAVYTSDVTTPKFTLKENNFPGIRNIIKNKSLLTFSDTEGYKEYNPQTDTVTAKYPLETPGILTTYLDFVYEIKGDTLTKYTKEAETLNGSVWAQNKDFEGAKGFTISISIYVIKADNTLVKYTSGTKDTFEIKGWDNTFINPIQILTNLDLNNIYIADKGNGSILIIDKQGTFIKHIKPDKESLWVDLKGIAVSPKEDKIYALGGSKVYEVTL